jgi:2-polyprenyl-6-methoxyphenol hydroxylase-like FAD-dependent oxidoreductase
VVGLRRDGAGVTVTARPSGNDDPAHRSSWRANWVVAADGARSTVRSLLGLPFPGQRVLSGVVLADVKLARPGDLAGLTLNSTRDGYAMLAPYARHDPDGAWFRSITWDRHSPAAESDPVREREIADVLRHCLGRDPGVVEVGSRSRFHCDERQVPDYRVDRVLLAGDAAHIHSPMGGQGMNTGIQDAANLAWKLDAVLGGADEAVLDSYHRERHPVGRYALRQSGMMLRSTVLRPRPARWLRDRLVPRLLALPPVADAVSGGLAGFTHHYRACGDRTRLVGTRATEVPLAEGRLTVLQRRPGFLLVRDRDSSPVTDAAGLPQAARTDEGPALLVRPDGYLAWAGSLRDAPAGGRWQDALARWTQPR